MELKKGYKGYQSFAYLEAGKDYKVFDLTDEFNSIAGHNEYLPLTEEEEVRAKKIVAKYPMISVHEHPFLYPRDLSHMFEYIREGRCFVPYHALAESNWDCIFDNMLDGVNVIGSKRGWKWNDVIYDLGMRLSDIAHQDFLIRCERVSDIYRAKAEGKIAWVPVIEGAAILENEVDRVEILYGLGVRQMGITYSESNALGSGLKEVNDGGLTYFGRDVVERMNAVGMLIDCSHCGPQTTKDVIAASKKPILISHVGARALWDCKRLQHDDVLKACADKGGVLGVEAAPHTTITRDNRHHSIESFMEHFEYIVNLVGIDHVTFGPDTLFGDHVTLHHVTAEFMSLKQAFVSTSGDFPEVPYVKYLDNACEDSHNILRWLIKHGYSDEEIAKVMGGNTIRVLNEVW